MKPGKFRVHCALSDCYYYLAEKEEDAFGESSQLIYCTYPERDLTSDDRPCPYYRMDWKKKMKLVQEKIQVNKAARAKAQSPVSSGVSTPPSSSQVTDKPAEPQKTETPVAPSPNEQPSPGKPETPLQPPDVFFDLMAQSSNPSNSTDLPEKGAESEKNNPEVVPQENKPSDEATKK